VGADPRRGHGRTPHVQVIFQNADASLNPRRTVRRVLARSIELLGGTQAVEELALRAGVAEELLDKLPHQLSGGQKQRVAIARAFAGPVPLVICDEPTSALDVSSQARLLDLLAELQDRTGVSYLFISHDLAVGRQVSDRIGVLHDGELVELKAAVAIFAEPGHWYTWSLVDSAFALRQLRMWSGRRACVLLVDQVAKLVAVADPELGESAVQVGCDGPGRQEQAVGDLGIAEAAAGEDDDLALLGGELGDGRRGRRRGLRGHAAGTQFGFRAPGPRCRPQAAEGGQGFAQDGLGVVDLPLPP
jgi:energy-coupling factor transporter ATP-binding protein EcfA2